MRISTAAAILCSMLPAIAGADLQYSQDFSGSSSFTLIPGGANTITTNTGSMVYSRTEGSVLGAMVKTGLPPVSGLFSVKMELDVFLSAAGSWAISMNDGSVFRELVAFANKGSGLKVIGGLDVQFTGNLGPADLALFVNNTATQQTYTDPSGASSLIDAGNVEIWAGETLMHTKAVTGMSTENDFSQLRFLFPGTSTIAGSFEFDDISIETIPEPSVMGLCGIALLGLLMFRRHMEM